MNNKEVMAALKKAYLSLETISQEAKLTGEEDIPFEVAEANIAALYTKKYQVLHDSYPADLKVHTNYEGCETLYLSPLIMMDYVKELDGFDYVDAKTIGYYWWYDKTYLEK